ncbi:MAG: response regulator [Gammaproteobacteria bacterium]|nr:response regulator [Gammaproteobacteria bacterium]
MNDALIKMLGEEGGEDAYGTDFSRYYPDEEQKRLRDEILPIVMQTGEWSGELTMRRRDGSLFPSHESFFVIEDEHGRPAFLGDVIADITERKRADEQFQRVVNALPVAVAIADSNGAIMMTNPQARKEFGNDTSLVGRNTSEFYAQEGQREKIVSTVIRDGQITGEEIQYRSHAGEIIDGLLSAIPITFDGQPALLGVVVNITERRRIERELARAKEQAEEANHFKGQFLANVSHEIRTPMNAIVGLGHLLNRTQLTPQQQDYLGKIQVSARSLLTLIDDILDLSKIDAGELRLESIDFDLGEILDNIVTLASTRLAEKPVEFVYDIEPSIPGRLRGDPYRLTQILTNLVGNATKFTDKGSIVVGIRLIDDGDPMRLQFAVQDTGIGIAGDKIEKLFAPFTQADGSTTREYGGSGLGLSICRQLCELMGGTISAESTPGVGSRFEFQLPFAVATPVEHAPQLDTANLRVLLVDDNTIARQVLGDLLLSLSFRVDVASSGRAALKRVVDENRPYDLVLIDWRMPEMDGIETTRKIRESGLHDQPRIILMTAYGREAMDAGIDLHGIDGFLVKPITPSQLLDAVSNAIQGGDHGASRPLGFAHVMTERHLRGQVLLVEDNPINQQVAREILQQMGLDVRIAGNAAQCLAMVAEERPDLVLMDIQMPDMDGYQATGQLRRMPGMAALPIIAMTANAMAGDAERSLAAGMNGHIAKPVDPVVLHKTLAAWLHGNGDHHDASMPIIQPGPDSGAGQAGIVTTEQPDAIDFTTGIMRVGGNRALYARLLEDFVARFGNCTDEIETACAQHDCAQAESALHTLKGVAGNIGAGAVQQVADKLETRARDNDVPGMRAGIPQLALALSQARDAARAFVDGTGAEAAHIFETPTPEDFDTDLERLAELIRDGDAEALAQASTLAIREASAIQREKLALLRDQLEDYDFSAAAQTLEALRSLSDDPESDHLV